MQPSTGYKLVEIFSSLQGEGAQVGRAANFIRLAGCNLSCDFCDTDKETKFEMGIPEILREITGPDKPYSVIITGGEPTLQDIEPLVIRLRQKGFWIGLETNGTRPLLRLKPFINYITVSPKSVPRNILDCRVNECRVMMEEKISEKYLGEIKQKIDANRYLISPRERGGKFNILETIRMLGLVNERGVEWGLSIQVHKLIGIR
jgi:organic radical activating enzyme